MSIILHTKNGEEIMGKVIHCGEDYWLIDNPVKITYSLGIPMYFTDCISLSRIKEITIKQHDVLYSYHPSKEVADYYSTLVECARDVKGDGIHKTIKGYDDELKQSLFEETIGKRKLNDLFGKLKDG